jgi:hypothetical protein
VIWYGSLTLLLGVIPLAFPEVTAWSWREQLDRAREWFRGRPSVRDTQSA